MIGALLGAVKKGVTAVGKQVGKGMTANENSSNLGKLIGSKLASLGDEKKGENEKVEGSLRKGGRIKKTGLYRLHKGEEVVPAGRKKANRKASRSCGRR
jgi:hypothetical protein